MKIVKLFGILSFYFVLFLVASYAEEPTCHAGVLGIDVSKNQGHIDWTKVANGGYKFAFIKASEGVGYTDKNFAENIKNASLNTLLVGAYHFARPAANNPEDEAKWFLQAAGDYVRKGCIRPVLDVEVPPSSYPETEIKKMEAMSESDLQDWVSRWMNYIKDETGQTPILYTNRDYYSGKLKKLINDENYDIWISDPSTTSCSAPLLDEQQPKYDHYPELIINWKFWQWYYPDPCASNKGQVPGINEDVDLDIFNGYESDLLSLTCDCDYGVAPVVQLFKVTPMPSSLNLGEAFTIDCTVSDNGGSGLKQVELWRREENEDWPNDPVQIKTMAGGNGPLSESFTDLPSSSGTYWYGLHVVDNAGNWNDEKNSNTKNPSVSFAPIKVEVLSSSIESCITAEAESWYNKGETYYDQKQYKEAIECYDEAIKICQQYEDAWIGKGDAYLVGSFGFFSQNDPDEAIRCYEEALKINPQNAVAWNNKGTALHALSKNEDAIQCYNEAIRIDPQYAEALYGMSHTLYEMGNYDEALLYVEKAISLQSEYPVFWEVKGDILKALGSEEAQSAFDKADELRSIIKTTHEARGTVSYD